MDIFQKPYNWLKNIVTPPWWKSLMAELQVMLIAIFQQVARGFILALQEKILELSTKNISNEAKMRELVKYAKYLMPTMKDSAINLICEVLFNKLKANKII